MRHVITGGSGFTGAALTYQLLERGEEVVNFDLKSPADPVLASSTRFICGDVGKHDDLAKLELGRDDVVYHLAARQFADAVPRRRRDAWFFETNVQGTQNVVDAMHAGGASHLVYFSTDMTYGTPKTCPVPPDHPQNPLGPYGRSKYAAEKILLSTESIRATIFVCG